MLSQSRRPAAVSVLVVLAVALFGCAPASERPVRGAVPGSDAAPTPPGVPPTLTPSEALRFHPQPSLASAASPVPLASPSAVAAPPIVRTIAPTANGHVPAGTPVNLSAVLVGRGADLASASLSVNGADSGAQIDKRTAREWSIHASQALGNGTHTAKVLVRDASGAAGGFTWQFSVDGADEGAGSQDLGSGARPSNTPQPKPSSP